MKGNRKAADKDTVNIDSPELSSKPPLWLQGHAAEVWTETVDDLKAAGRPLLALHKQILINLCSAAADLRESGEILEREGYMVDGGRDGAKRHPAVAIRTGAFTAVRANAAEIGLTPTSASRLPPIKAQGTKNEFADI